MTAARRGSKRPAASQLTDAQRKRVRQGKDQARKERVKKKQEEEEKQKLLNPMSNQCNFCATDPVGMVMSLPRPCDWTKYGDFKVECSNCADHRSRNPGLAHECRVGEEHIDHRRYGINDPAVPAVAACKPCSDKHKGDTCNVDVHLGYQCTSCRKGRCRAGGVQLKPRPDPPGVPYWYRHACDRCQADSSGGRCTWLDNRNAWNSSCQRCSAGGHLCLCSNTLVAAPNVPAPKSWVIPNARDSEDAGTLELQRTGPGWRKWCKACAVSKTLYSCRVTESMPFSSCVRCNQLGIDCIETETNRGYPLADLSRVGFGKWTPFQGCAPCQEKGRPCDRQRPCDSCTSNGDRPNCDKWMKSKLDRMYNCVAQFEDSPPALYYLAHGYGPGGVDSVKDGTKLLDWIGPLVAKYSTLNPQERAKNMVDEIIDAHNDFRPDQRPPHGGRQGTLHGLMPSAMNVILEHLMRGASHVPFQNPAYQQKLQGMSHPEWPPTREGFGAPLGRPIAAPAPESPQADAEVANPPVESPPVMNPPVMNPPAMDPRAPIAPVTPEQCLPMRAQPLPPAISQHQPPANNPARFAGVQVQAQIPPFQQQLARGQNNNIAQPEGDANNIDFQVRVNADMSDFDFNVDPVLEAIGDDNENSPAGVGVQSDPMDPSGTPQGLGEDPYMKNWTKPSRWSAKNNLEGLEMSHWRQGEKVQSWDFVELRLFGVANGKPIFDTPARDILGDIPLVRRQDTLQQDPLQEWRLMPSCMEPEQGGMGICSKPAADEVGCQALIHRTFPPFNYLVCTGCVAESVKITVDESLKPLTTSEIVKTRAYTCNLCTRLVTEDKEYAKALGKTGAKHIWGNDNPESPVPGEAQQGEDPSIVYQKDTMPITGCACATKLLDRPLCRFHRLHYAELSMRHAAMMQEWRLCRFSKPVCPACVGGSESRDVGISADCEGFKNIGEHGTAWACLVCNDWVVDQHNDGNNSPRLVDGSWDGIHQAKDIIVGKTTDRDTEGA
ncbi:hypothetical protein B0J13DRAFT_620398 [Dactylonectria estremocensis]|uniref:Uncharacterized protein n=1 Tax=Dactylonectria estremocensis TaxID=1079267 RepID=A0A9P9J6H5_9HYPO|nr:hypothetical protein B0J13DRAFT_620398 [Dactylonectria estremocensis]